MKHILIYGDSLVYGKVPGKPQRFPFGTNFTEILSESLGKEYYLIPEGLRARTLGGENGFFPERNGLEQFGPIFGSHVPLDLVCIMLGSNDCNGKDVKTFEEIQNILKTYTEKVLQWCTSLSISTVPRIMFIAPPLIRDTETQKDEGMKNIFPVGAEARLKQISDIMKTFCEQNECIFFDTAAVCQTADGEGVHLDEENNKKLGIALALYIKNL